MTTPPVEETQDQTQEAAPEGGARPAASEQPPKDGAAARQAETGASSPREDARGIRRDERPTRRPRERDGGRRDRRERRFRRPRRKVCAFCVDKVTRIDYKDYGRLREFVSDRGKILKSRMTGTCARHQRALSRAIKRARHIALLPFVSE